LSPDEHERTVSHRRLLGAALFPLGVFAVHQLRDVLAFGSDAPHALAGQGHGYLLEMMPWIVLAVALGFGGLLVRLAHAWCTGVGDDERVAVRPRRVALPRPAPLASASAGRAPPPEPAHPQPRPWWRDGARTVARRARDVRAVAAATKYRRDHRRRPGQDPPLRNLGRAAIDPAARRRAARAFVRAYPEAS
jgi:hypothetical protein